MITCIECRQSWTTEPNHKPDCAIPAIAILKQITKLEELVCDA